MHLQEPSGNITIIKSDTETDSMDGEKRFKITDERVLEYISDILKPYDGIEGSIGLYRSRHDLPTADTMTLRLLEILTRIRKPGRILEIGTAEGRSAIVLAKASTAIIVDTIEIDLDKAAAAMENFEKAKLSDRINLIAGDACEVLTSLDRKYGLIFIDAAKGQYLNYYNLCVPMLEPGGIIFADNILYRGMTAGGARINRRQRLLVRRLREYIDNAVKDERFITDILPVGDGVCISYLKEKELNEEG